MYNYLIMTEEMAVRRNVDDLTASEREELNQALGNMKALNSQNNWKSFEKVSNYHGEPYLCNEQW